MAETIQLGDIDVAVLDVYNKIDMLSDDEQRRLQTADPAAALIEFKMTDEAFYCFILTGNSTRWIKLPDEKKIQENIFSKILIALFKVFFVTFIVIYVGGQFITALLIAGGSDGIFRIFTVLKIRNPEERDQKAKEAQKALAAKKKQRKR